MNDSADPDLTIETRADGAALTLRGPITLAQVSRLHRRLSALPGDGDIHVDLAGVSAFDTAGAWALCSLRARIAAAGRQMFITGEDARIRDVMASVQEALPTPDTAASARHSLADRLELLGRAIMGGLRFGAELVGFLGLFLARLARALIHPREFRLTSLVHHCQEVGLKAVPIVALMAFLIGVVLAFQGASQLRQFGAEVFVVDLIAISVLRELGILLTAIIVAGRTASAFTATIGAMKMREEIDAMRTLGLDPAMVLFVPRILALVLMLPILGLIANIMGLLGGAIMSWLELGISPAMFRTRLVEGTGVNHVMVGMVKAPVFALLIGIIGCHAGMQVQGNTDSLGRRTSQAVVTAIFAVIVADALFSVFFARIGV